MEDEVNQCPRSKTCMTLPLWEHMQAQFKEYMEKLTLQDVLDKKFDVSDESDDDEEAHQVEHESADDVKADTSTEVTSKSTPA